MIYQNNFARVGTAPKVSAIHVVALYDPKNGRIAHLHAVQVFEGGKPVSEAEAIKEAKRCAAQAGHRVAAFKIKISNDLAHALRPHRINPKTGKFQALSGKLIERRQKSKRVLSGTG